ncbi:MAG TPA: type III-A CRISPR-associated protein Csm2 [Syntrophomonadaceae bacterium]|nr:type III-A CRISPR-associated protein Csm2 [Syntrophomonadaceae bacterium]
MSPMKEAFKKAGYKEGEKAKTNFNLPSNYTEKAEKVIIDLQRSMGRNYRDFTTSKIRNILTLISEIYNDIVLEAEEELNQDYLDRIEYLKVRLVYESGREPQVVKPFERKAELIKLLDSIGNSKANFIKFARYMEALVAYHRFYGGKE